MVDYLYSGDSEPGGMSNMSSKKNMSYLKSKRIDSQSESNFEFEDSVMDRKQKDKKGDPSKEKILVYMQYFD